MTEDPGTSESTTAPVLGVRIPAGLRIEATRVRIRPGLSERADDWMRMLNARHDECVATLDRERMAFEVIVRLHETDGQDQLLWITMRGRDGHDVSTSDHQVDLAHRTFATEVTAAGGTPAPVELVLLPEPVEKVMVAWAAGAFGVAADVPGTGNSE